MIQATPDHPSWASFAMTSTGILIGAFLGFGLGRLKDLLDERKAKKGFLKAIRVELSTIREHLKGTLTDANEAKKSLEGHTPHLLHLATVFQTSVYATQLGKLRDVSDPLILEVIWFYDKLSNLERIKSHLTASSFELRKLTGVGEDMEKEGPILALYISSLDEVIKRISDLVPKADTLIALLPL